MMRIDPERPRADGIPFDDLAGFTRRQQNLLAARGVVFLTSFTARGRDYAGSIIAASLAAAEEIAFARGLGERIDGMLVAVIPAEGEP